MFGGNTFQMNMMSVPSKRHTKLTAEALVTGRAIENLRAVKGVPETDTRDFPEVTTKMLQSENKAPVMAFTLTAKKEAPRFWKLVAWEPSKAEGYPSTPADLQWPGVTKGHFLCSLILVVVVCFTEQTLPQEGTQGTKSLALRAHKLSRASLLGALSRVRSGPGAPRTALVPLDGTSRASSSSREAGASSDHADST